ncbi:hypothetical protein PSEUDO8Z_10512 [Pseudomonas sp. 8Z]|nr:hypothetical protein PSEUDO8Z_10512 [Pseudomonas sp. 8Z]
MLPQRIALNWQHICSQLRLARQQPQKMGTGQILHFLLLFAPLHPQHEHPYPWRALPCLRF